MGVASRSRGCARLALHHRAAAGGGRTKEERWRSWGFKDVLIQVVIVQGRGGGAVGLALEGVRVMVMATEAGEQAKLFISFVCFFVANVSHFYLLLRLDVRDGLHLHSDVDKKQKNKDGKKNI